LRGIPARPRGVPRIDVTLGYDASGVIRLYAKEQTSGLDISSEIECPGLMSEAEIERAAEHVSGLRVS
jgi:molecular chaperone DnaK